MFRKLMKYELKDCLRVFLPLWGALLALSLINGFTMGQERLSQNALLQFLVHILPLLLLIVLSVGMFVVALVLIVRRFYNGLLGEGGTLAFTLPVHCAQHIGAKLLTALIMVAGCFLAGALATFLMSLIRGYGADLKQILPFLQRVYARYDNVSLLAVESVVLIILWFAFVILRLYAGMAVGHLFGSHRGLWSVLAVIGIGWIFNFVTIGAARIFHGVADRTEITISVESAEDFFNVMAPIFGIAIVSLLVGCAVLWAVTQIILQKKLNIL